MKTKEIGSEFLLEKINSKKISKEYEKCLFLENGRQCYKVLNDKLKGKILFPAYACESMIQNIGKDRIIYYDVDYNLDIDFHSISDEDINSAEAFVYINYYGFSQSKKNLEKIQKLKEKNILIVEDITHSAFSGFEFIGDVLICSIRKWFGIEGLGILYTNKFDFTDLEFCDENTFSSLRYKGFMEKESFLNGKDVNKIYLETFANAEDYANHFMEISRSTSAAMCRFYNYDYEQMIKKRRENYLFLEKNLLTNNVYQIKKLNQETPLFFPVYAKHRDDLRQYLIKNNIFCPIHWPKLDSIDSHFAVHQLLDNILSIPIDQRYDINDMTRIIETITDFYENDEFS
jgi:hypothetical protein